MSKSMRQKIEELSIPPSRTACGRQRCVLPMPPSINNLFVNKRSGGRAKSEQYRSWIEQAGWEAKRCLLPYHPDAYPVTLIYTVLIRDLSAFRMDLANTEKATTDLLVTARILENDTLHHVSDILLRPRGGCEIGGIEVVIVPTRLVDIQVRFLQEEADG